jgi:hypothetical protein
MNRKILDGGLLPKASTPGGTRGATRNCFTFSTTSISMGSRRGQYLYYGNRFKFSKGFKPAGIAGRNSSFGNDLFTTMFSCVSV